MVDLTGWRFPPLQNPLARSAPARRRIRASRQQITSAVMLLAGMGLGLLGGALIGRWCLGLVLIAEAAGLIAVGLLRDDGTALPRRGSRTIDEVLDAERRYPEIRDGGL